MVIRSAELLDGKKSGSVKKKILVLVDWYEPGFKAGGPIQACKNVVTSLKGSYEFFILCSDRDLGDRAPYEGIPINQWIKKELRSFCDEHIERMAQRDFIQGDHLRYSWRLFLNGDKNIRWTEIWLFVVLNYWMEKNQVQ